MSTIYQYFLVLLSLCSTLAAPATNVMSSICGNNGTNYMLFTNEQDIKEQNKFVHTGQTAFKLSPLGCCLLQYRDAAGCASQNIPICAIDIATNVTRAFNNSCIMEETACKQNVDWRFVQNGLCNAVGIDPVPCTKVYKPVCAIFAGVKTTFSSECLVNAENLRTGADWRIYLENICTEDIIHHIPRESRSSAANLATDKYTSTGIDLEDELKDVTYIHTVPQYETKFISNPSPSIVQSLLEKGSSLSNVVSLGTSEFDTSDYTQYAEKTIQFPHDILANSEDLINSAVHRASFDERSPLELWQSTDPLENSEYPVDVSSPYLQAQNLLPIGRSDQIPSDYLHPNNLHISENTQTKVLNNTNKSEIICEYGSTPICGILEPGKTLTFGNICEMMLKNIKENTTWSTLHTGKCGECDLTCEEAKYEPVCVLRKGISYTLTNICYMGKNICLKGSKEWTLLHEGGCNRTTEIETKPGYANDTNSNDDSNTKTTIAVTSNMLTKPQ